MTPKPAKGIVALVLRHTGFAGVALAPFGIYILPEQLNNQRLVEHEQIHWKQWQRMGTLKYYATYLYQVLRYGYHNSPMEKEARGEL